MILDPANALFKDNWLVHHDVPEDLIEQVTIGVDPSGAGDEVGIVACALLNDERHAVLADRTTVGSPAQCKAMRAEPISLLYEKGRVWHRRGLDQLEAEMMAFSREWDRAVDGSPNRLDAAVWGLTRLSKVITQIPIA